ncbi:MAG TPA: amino acid ABC transporter permease [Egibacteraceae bacterium]|nr:amino acid ABC transporter permease [Egibacteraceae bacterium]
MERLREGYFDVELMARAFPDLLREGLANTVILSFAAMALGLAAGMALALMAISRRWWVRLPAKIYIDIFRGLPAILTIVLVGLGLPTAGFRPFGRNTFAYAILALGMIATAYIAEIYRAGIESVDPGQMEAARSVGMPYLMAMWVVVIPQGVRRVLPPLTNEFIALIKDSSLVFVLGLSIGDRELFRVGQSIVNIEANYSPLVMAGVFYLFITIPLTHLVNLLDRHLRDGGGVATDEELPASANPAPRRA